VSRLGDGAADLKVREAVPASTRLLAALARAANAVFFLVTAAYCILTYSSFAYQQFIRPRLVASLAGFVAFHHLWHWVFLGLIVLTLVPEWKTSRGRTLAWGYVAAMAAVGLLLIYRPVLPAVENDGAGLWLACLFLLPPIWLAVYDHVATGRRFDPLPADPGRLVVAMAAAGALVWAMNAVSAPLHVTEMGDYTTGRGALLFGVAVSLAVHVGIFTGLGIATAVLLHATGRRGGTYQYWTIAALACVASTLIIEQLVFSALSFRGAASWLVASETAVALTSTWSAIARRIAAGRPVRLSAVDAWIAAMPGTQSRRLAAASIAAVPFGLYVAIVRAETFDWNFLVQNLCVLSTWIAIAMLVHACVRPMRVRPGRPVAMAGMAIVAVAGVGAGTIDTAVSPSQQFVPEFVLDAYSTIDPSYRLTRQMLTTETPASRRFFATLAANSLIERVDVQPVDISFAHPLTPAAQRPPHVFLFVIDSLRRDYLSPYNPTVTFTPAIGAFARQNLAFTRAYTAYGGTGLSMPAIWAGSMLLHKEYVQPFEPMNALEKLVTANHYQAAISLDHITQQIISPQWPVTELDAGRDEMQYDFCTTLEELERKLHDGLAGDRPVFAHTRSLNLHISKLTTRVGAPDASFGEFQGPAAAAIERMDSCFGRFITDLQQRGLYDDSIVILTADHGDALGEARRWGHAYTLFPEIVRTPLLMHVPRRLLDRFAVDEDALAMSTDITPSLYALLGYPNDPQSWPMGRSLFVPPGTDDSARRREPTLIASSYGPVYGVLRDNGERLYIADGVNRRDYAYDLRNLEPVRTGVTASMREESRAFIAGRLAALAALYHFTPGS
jgi:hypothetical protein